MKPLNKIDFYLLSINQKKASFYRICNGSLNEIKGSFFPAVFKDDYEYSKTSRGNSFGFALKGFEKDKSIVKKERFNHFLKIVNGQLMSYLKDNNTALLLAGTNKDRADFKKISDFNYLTCHEISGRYNSGNLNKLKKSVLEVTRDPNRVFYGIPVPARVNHL